jgi:hypothetical protein
MLALFQPCGPLPVHAMLGAHGPAWAFRLLVALELVQGGEQGPGLAIAQPQLPVPATHGGLEVDPGLGDAAGLRGFLAVGDLPAGRLDPIQGGAQHVGDVGASLEGPDVPGERDQVTPEAVLGEQAGGLIRVVGGQGRAELGEPGGDHGRGVDRRFDRRFGRLGSRRHRLTPIVVQGRKWERDPCVRS